MCARPGLAGGLTGSCRVGSSPAEDAPEVPDRPRPLAGVGERLRRRRRTRPRTREPAAQARDAPPRSPPSTILPPALWTAVGPAHPRRIPPHRPLSGPRTVICRCPSRTSLATPITVRVHRASILRQSDGPTGLRTVAIEVDDDLRRRDGEAVPPPRGSCALTPARGQVRCRALDPAPGPGAVNRGRRVPPGPPVRPSHG